MMERPHDDNVAVVFDYHGATLEELVAQPYPNMKISAGTILEGYVPGHRQNSIYLRIESDDAPETMLFLRLDEAAAVVYALGGVLYSQTIGWVEAER
jgi:hypothetical protein